MLLILNTVYFEDKRWVSGGENMGLGKFENEGKVVFKNCMRGRHAIA